MNQLNRYNRKVVIPSVARNKFDVRATLLFVLILTISTTTNAQQSAYDIIKIDSCPDITLLEEPKLYVGDDLFSLINGGAEIYHEYGFVEVLAGKMSTASGVEVKAEIYDMGSSGSAWGIYSVTGTSDAIDLSVGDAGRSGNGFLQFIKGKYMVYMHFKLSEEEGFRQIESLAECLSNNIISSEGAPSMMTILNELEPENEKTLYFLGNLGLSNAYSFHYKDVFGFKEGAAAVSAEKKVLLLNYPDEVQCLENYNSARDFFLNSKKYHDQVSMRGSFHMKDRKEQQIDCYFENTFLVIFISSGEADLNPLKEEIVGSMQ